jgi:hypothetical protein
MPRVLVKGKAVECKVDDNGDVICAACGVSGMVDVQCMVCGAPVAEDGAPPPPDPLPEPPPETPSITPNMLRRNTDPETSDQAAQEIILALQNLHSQITLLVCEYPGRVARELSDIRGDWDIRVIGRRLNEVEKLGYVRRGPAKETPGTGRMAETWWPTERALRETGS